ncbi:saccharopine dehydrogenase NADP-binding domain-containing protein [Glaciecola sp. XM2]|uniref:saccharopine dehydrogenase family protein n=1 Tax=Glaciecola sp. XM2 TaxID=1914931 RepID=UPI001BDF1EDD|nr:saccharopine dehydrogenase NADP-binding domain-containing protein [Glaciecola sp. XM2]MBT1451491.1 saccharopine dehydrogenase NADP-binding domain-containing protein [Glaciecola sp. XM2]
MRKEKKEFDLMLYGATSFVGQIMVAYLKQFSQEEFTWAIAGRDEGKLKALKQEHGLTELEHFVADASDEAALTQLCKKANVIISTVGPYALYGETLVRACVQTGTDYCDLTGEPQWIRAMLDKYEEQAKASGARIVNCAGFDSIPSDLGVYMSQRMAIEKTGNPASQIKMRVYKLKGAASGGTVASLLNVLKEAGENPSLKKLLVNPYVLCGSDHPFSLRQKNHKKAEFDEALGIWTMPFVMAAINERIVHRSNALLNGLYGKEFRYDEAMSAKKGSAAWMATLGLGAFVAAASIGPVRNLLAKYVLPKPGEGPSPEAQEKGMFDMRFYATLSDGQTQVVQVTGDKDPGYGSTAKMLSQAALCLAKDTDDLAGGFWTPASAMGDALITRLSDHAGVVVKPM